MFRALYLVPLLAAEAAGAVYVESWQGFREARLIQCCLLVLFLVALIGAVHGRWRDWLLGILSLFVGIIVLEGIALAIETTTPTTTDSGLSHDRPVVGWGAGRPGVYRVEKHAPDGRLIYDVDVTIDQNLNRQTIAKEGSGGTAFFGDSFTFGEGLPDAGSLPQVFADLTKRTVPVFNLGYSGWSPSQNLAALQAGLYRRLLEKPRRFVLMTAAWHVERTACKAGFSLRAPRYEAEDGVVKLEGRCAGPVLIAWHGLVARFALYRVVVRPGFSTPTRADVDTYLKIVETFVKTARRDYGAPTTILFIPYDDAYLKPAGWTEAQLVGALRKTGADVLVDALPPIADPKLYQIQGDGHPTALANTARAKMLLAHLATIGDDRASGDAIHSSN